MAVQNGGLKSNVPRDSPWDLGKFRINASRLDLDLDRRRNRLALAHPLLALKLGQCPIEGSLETRFIFQQTVQSFWFGNIAPDDL